MKRIAIMAALVTGMVAGAMFSGGTLAAGYDTSGCTAADLGFVVDGIAQHPHAPGSLPPALICGGTSYVPTRFMAAALQQTVAWDGATRTITIGQPASGTLPTCLLRLDINGGTHASPGTVVATYGEASRDLSQPSQKLEVPCGTSVVLTEKPSDPSVAAFQDWTVETADGETASTASTLEIRLSGDTTVVQADYAAPQATSAGQ